MRIPPQSQASTDDTRSSTSSQAEQAPTRARLLGAQGDGSKGSSGPRPELIDVTAKPLDDPSLFLNRELSALEFNRRVLEQARDPNTPLLERLRFLTISTSNLDEFFEVRVATLKQRLEFGIAEPDADGKSPRETLQLVSELARGLVEEQYRVLNDELLPALGEAGIAVLRRNSWDSAIREWVLNYFQEQVLPVLTPVALDPAHPFPRILNKSLNFIVTLDGKDAFGRNAGTAILQVPRSLPRLIALPPELCPKTKHKKSGHPIQDGFVLLSAVLRQNIEEVFPGLKVTGCYQFRVTRNSDLWVDQEEVHDLLKALKGELPGRRYGDAVRLEVARNCTEEQAQMLLSLFGMNDQDLYRVSGPVNLHRLGAVYDEVDRPDLKYKSFTPAKAVPEIENDLFSVLDQRDVLLHHPFQSFSTVLEFLRQAANDPNVLAIKQTLYRTGKDSSVVAALLEAARNGKEVTAVIELMARFDEERNIDLANQLQEAGANVVYGIFGFKTHAKMLMVVRREGEKLRRYIHLGTGNYHAGTARAYTDVGLMTARPQIGLDVHRLFNELTGLGKAARLKRLIQSPFELHKQLLEWIDNEIDFAKQGKPAFVQAKMNSLTEPEIIRALYRASCAGVQVDLIVRGICCLRPGLPKVSENISVRSVVGRFLEHSRIYCFHNGGKRLVHLASADWMHRNLFRRVETCVPIREQELADRVYEECIQHYLKDNTQAWELTSDGTYRRAQPKEKEAQFSAQETLMKLSSSGRRKS